MFSLTAGPFKFPVKYDVGFISFYNMRLLSASYSVQILNIISVHFNWAKSFRVFFQRR